MRKRCSHLIIWLEWLFVYRCINQSEVVLVFANLCLGDLLVPLQSVSNERCTYPANVNFKSTQTLVAAIFQEDLSILSLRQENNMLLICKKSNLKDVANEKTVSNWQHAKCWTYCKMFTENISHLFKWDNAVILAIRALLNTSHV